jgi:hypothetical protein
MADIKWENLMWFTTELCSAEFFKLYHMRAADLPNECFSDPNTRSDYNREGTFYPLD